MIRTTHRLFGLAVAFVVFSSAPTATIGGDADEAFPAASPESQGLSRAALAELTAEARAYVERDLVVGAELLVIQNRRTVLHEVFGCADRDEDAPWVDGTICNIRSMTKPLTGAVVQILVDRGALALDDPVAKYLPGFDTDAARGITIVQLLTHRAGLPLTALRARPEISAAFRRAIVVPAKARRRRVFAVLLGEGATQAGAARAGET